MPSLTFAFLFASLLVATIDAFGQVQLDMVLPSCSDTPSLCETEEERKASQARLDERRRRAEAARKIADAERARKEAEVQAFTARFGAHRDGEARKFQQMREAAMIAANPPVQKLSETNQVSAGTNGRFGEEYAYCLTVKPGQTRGNLYLSAISKVPVEYGTTNTDELDANWKSDLASSFPKAGGVTVCRLAKDASVAQRNLNDSVSGYSTHRPVYTNINPRRP